MIILCLFSNGSASPAAQSLFRKDALAANDHEASWNSDECINIYIKDFVSLCPNRF